MMRVGKVGGHTSYLLLHPKYVRHRQESILVRSGDPPTGRVICIAYKRPGDLSSSETEQTCHHGVSMTYLQVGKEAINGR